MSLQSLLIEYILILRPKFTIFWAAFIIVFLTLNISALELKVKDREKIFDSLKGNKFTILKAEDKLTDKRMF